MDTTVRVSGLRELSKACRDAGKETSKFLRDDLKAGGELVAQTVRGLLDRYGGDPAGGVKVRFSGGGVRVEQSHRKVTGLRPDFGALQMTKAFIPARDTHEAEVVALVERTLDLIVERF